MDKDDKSVEIVGVITDARKFTTKQKKEMMSVFTLEDKEDKVKCVLFPKSYSQFGHFIEDNSVVYVSGKFDSGEIYVDEIRDTATMLKKGVTGATVTAPISSGTIARVKSFLGQQENGKIPFTLKLQGVRGAVELEAGEPVQEFIKTEMEAKRIGLDFEWRK
jgi:DNA polymerase III alpha subunit